MPDKQLSHKQQIILNDLISWFNGSLTFGVLHGTAGSGKTFLVRHFLQDLQDKVRPLLLAETNEAVAVLAKSVNNKYPCKTVCAALGLSLSYEEAKKVLKQKNSPDLTMYNLLIVDEASMQDNFKLALLKLLGIRTLFIGHKSQLPPVDTELKTTDKCISPVFLQNYATFSLMEEQRNRGELAVFCREAEALIYKRGVLSRKFLEERKVIDTFLKFKKNIQDIVDGKCVFLSYTNEQAKIFNKQIRLQMFGAKAELEDFIIGDKIIFRSPVAAFKFPIASNANSVDKILNSKKNPCVYYTTNTRATVVYIDETTILDLPVYELHVVTNHYDKADQRGIVYVAMDDEEFASYMHKLYITALYAGVSSSEKEWKKYHEVSYLFTNTKHAYATTIYCAQGSTYETVFVDDADIDKCNNPYLKKKMKYVGYSRASKHLYRLAK